jgi:exonuclease SbcC
VVLGPNEAGKSTLFRAVRHALLVPTKLSRPGYAAYVSPYLPIGGGDSIRIELDFTVAAARWTLTRRWGASAGSELLHEKGGSITDDAELQAQLARLLPATPAVVSSILLTGQSELAETVTSLRADKHNPLADVADALRRTVQETGGISVDRFAARLAQKREKAFAHWDGARNGPQKDGSGRDRGIEFPWKQDVGMILQAWYGAENARVLWRKALACEAELDAVNQRLRTAAARLSERSAFLDAHAGAARDARERRMLEAERGRISVEADTLRTVSSDWPVARNKMVETGAAMAGLKEACARLEKDLHAARKSEEGRSLREKRAKILRRAAQVEEARRNLAAAPRLDRKALEEIRRAASVVDTLLAAREAGRISVTVAGRAAVDLVVQEDWRPEIRRKLGPGETAQLSAGGRVRIVHPDMEIEIRSGDADADAREEKLAPARQALQQLLDTHRAADIGEAEVLCVEYERRAAELAAAHKNLSEDLAGETVDEVEARFAALGPEEPSRPSAEIAASLAAMTAQADAHARELESLGQKIQAWEKTYGSTEKLMDLYAEKRARHNELASRIEKCAPLPAPYSDAAEFLLAFDRAQKEQADLRVEHAEIEGDKRALAERAPDQSAEELAGLVKDAEETFATEKRRGEALQRVEAARLEALGAGESVLYDGMRDRLEKTLARMTAGRHTRVILEGSMPSALSDGNGSALPWDMLSAGTKDALALALRLAMAGYFIQGSDGFLMMDDPLVDMDPERQEASAAALQSFADGRQLILFTCQPSTAALLGGRLVTLDAAG